jgi:hypothetical protein
MNKAQYQFLLAWKRRAATAEKDAKRLRKLNDGAENQWAWDDWQRAEERAAAYVQLVIALQKFDRLGNMNVGIAAEKRHRST